MTCGGSGALNDYHGRAHLMFGMHSNVIYMCACDFPCGQRGPCGSVATISAFMAQIPGVSDRMSLCVESLVCRVSCVSSFFCVESLFVDFISRRAQGRQALAKIL
jgi:hypothetical protein